MAQTTVDTLLIKIEADMKSLKREMDKVKKTTQQTSKGVGKGFDGINKKLKETSKTARNVGLAIGTAFAGVAIKKIINTGQSIESLQIRLKALFGSAEEGAKAFDQMAKFAATVPFSLQQIQTGSGALAAVSTDAEHLGEILRITGNVAAITGLDFATTSMQIQRSFSAGIGAADLFRERAVRSLLGFQAGADVSVEETIAKFKEKFGKGGEFGETTNELANTLSGTLSMIGDKVFNFQRLIADEGFFNEVKGQFKDLDKFLEENGETIDELAKDVSKGLIVVLTSLVKVLKVVADNSENLRIGITSLATAFIGLKIIGGITALIKMYTAGTTAAALATLKFNTALKSNLFFAAGAGLIFLADKYNLLDKAMGKVDERLKDPKLINPFIVGGADPRFGGVSKEVATPKAPKVVKDPQKFTEALAEMETEIQLLGLRTEKEREFQELLNETGVTESKHIEQLKEKFEVIKELEEAQEKNNEIMQDAESIIEGNKTEQEKLNEQILIFEEALNNVAEQDVPKVEEALKILKEELRELDPLMKEITQIFDRASASISQALADSITEGKNLMESLGNITRQVVNQMIAEFLRLQVIRPLMSSIFGGMGGGGGSRGGGGGSNIFGNIFSGLMTGLGFILGPETGGASVPIMNVLGSFGSSAIHGITSGGGTSGNFGSFNTGGGNQVMGFAGGGTIAPNRAVMVGERGPEIFVPNSGGKLYQIII